MMTVGFIGLGAMGAPMAGNLIKKGYKVKVYDLSAEAVDQLVQAGASPAESCAQAADDVDVLITMLPSSPHVRQAMLGEKGVLETIAPPTVYIDTSTIDPITSRDIAGRLEAKGVAALDAPVTKGVKAAIAGELSIYVGGEESVLSAVRPVLEAMGSSIYHMGPIGAGQTTKLANAVCLAAITAASAEAVVFGAKAGVDPDKLVQAIFQGSGSSRPLKTHIHDYAMRRTFDKPAFPVHLMMKDLTLVMDTAREMDMPVFFTSLSHEVLAMLKAKGRGKGFFAEVMTIYEDYAGITVEGGQDEL